MEEITFIHCADLHLDSPMLGLKNLPAPIRAQLRESTFASFRKIVDTAIARQVDFVLIAGDIYDGEDRSLRAQILFKKEMERLKIQEIDVYIIHGNHDHLSGSWLEVSFPDNVHIFPSDVTVFEHKKRNTKIHLYGFSYETRHLYDRRINTYEKTDTADYHIGLLHGSMEGNSDHSPYAPFNLQELASKGMNYWALGHIHKRAVLQADPPVVYPGNIQGRHKKETGEKGCYYVKLNNGDAELEFIPTATCLWKSVQIDAAGAKNADELLSLCHIAQEKERDQGLPTILAISIINAEGIGSLQAGELLEILQEDELDETNFAWISSLSIIENISWNKAKLESDSAFFTELFQAVKETDSIDEAVAPIYRHPGVYRYLSELTEREKEELAEEAERLLLTMLNGVS
ncbi:DNA repair exonuclease [Niallia taxi]|uniref:metallophosphoesterase family protein n=1 Tax=Niallia taxi TaxID=2499688 RepID=UPI002E1AF6A9|nr:DNA repair exonuclease [Niallia taxi]